jgi:hypothetical protein
VSDPTPFQRALEELNERVTAVASLERDSGETIATVTGEPDDLIRQVISGYVPTEDTGHVLEFLHNAGREVTRMIRNTDHPAAAHAGVRFTVAQMIVLGVALGKGDTAKLRRLAVAARDYHRELGHFSHTTADADVYPEEMELRAALEALYG